MVGLGRGHPWVLNRVGVDPAESPARFEEGIRMLVEIFISHIENSRGTFWRVSDFKLSPRPPGTPSTLVCCAATTPDSNLRRENRPGLVSPLWAFPRISS
jgi:alkanesulfonate monooxygenase SsuD/methylene tetrahydromethanopterin reductase-like flavin-dependent oxidoreductase (luciferase family)